MIEIPYGTDKRPDSGMTSPILGLWLFLASELMLFGSLFSSYVLLRLGSDDWPQGGDRLHVASGAINTVVLVLSSVTVFMAWEAARSNRRSRTRVLLLATAGLSVLFLVNKLHEYKAAIAEGFVPSYDIFSAIYFTLTGVHALHLVGGLVVLLYLAGPGFGDFERRPAVFAQRVELTGTYWHFVDVIWLILFPVLYLT